MNLKRLSMNIKRDCLSKETEESNLDIRINLGNCQEGKRSQERQNSQERTYESLSEVRRDIEKVPKVL